MTIAQYEIMLEALEYQMVDDEYRAHRQAFLNFALQAEKKIGKEDCSGIPEIPAVL